MKSYINFIKESTDWNKVLHDATWTHKKQTFIPVVGERDGDSLYLMDLDKIKIAVKNGADVECCSTLEWAVRNNNFEVVKYMLENGANVNYQNNDCKWTPLMLASDVGNVEIAKILIDYNADPLIGNFQNINVIDILTPAMFGYNNNVSKDIQQKRDQIYKYYIIHLINKTPMLAYKYINYLTEEEKEKYKEYIELASNIKKFNV